MRALLTLSIVVAGLAGAPAVAPAEACEGAGPQSPRDIGQRAGSNPRVFSIAPPPSQMNLCNVHLHENAEHKGPGFHRPAGEGGAGGYRCGAATELSESERAPIEPNHCENVSPGDTIEVHWVFTSCGAAPGPGLGSCLTASCSNPQLRVEAQVFLVVHDDAALDFSELGRPAGATGPYWQPEALPEGTGDPVVYLGSTTGSEYDDTACSPLQVTWSVRPECARVDASSLSAWCGANIFEESEAHGVRALVTRPELLSPIGTGD
jgi:hypothetical protein